MPLNPFTGEIGGYDAPSTVAGAGMVSLETAGIQNPLAFRMLEDMPSATSAFFFSINRGSNTLLKGGYADGSKRRFTKDFFGQRGPIASKYTPGSTMLSRRATRMQAAGKTPFARPAMRNMVPMPRNLTRLDKLSIFSDPSHNKYSPFSISSMLNNKKIGPKLAEKITGEALTPGTTAFGPGLLSFITAGRKADVLERKALGGSERALRKLGTLDRNISKLADLNNPGMGIAGVKNIGDPNLTRLKSSEMSYSQRGKLGYLEYYDKNKLRATRTMSFTDDAMTKAVGVLEGPIQAGARPLVGGQVGVRGNMLASTASGEGTRYLAGYFRGAMGYAETSDLQGQALRGATKAVEHLASESVAKRGLAMGAKYAGMAIPGVNLIATAALVYDLGKMAGEVVKSGINLARDAGKSLQGTIAKPLFGMGYRDTEAAATSRSRGVMAIQNSRLNMRSLLGNEASMMASYYG